MKPEQTRRTGLNMTGINSRDCEGNLERGGLEGALLELLVQQGWQRRCDYFLVEDGVEITKR